MGTRTFVGFGFGPIQSGLFLLEAQRSGAFDRLVVAEIAPPLVAAVRANGGRSVVNVARADGIVAEELEGLELRNPRDPADRAALVEAIANASELATALPSIAAFGGADVADAARVLANGLARKLATNGPRAVLYAAENHNHAAEHLEAAVRAAATAPLGPCAFLNTVIGKMSGVVSGGDAIRDQHLAPIAPDLDRAFLVEAFNRILISQVPWPDFSRGLAMFEEKADLLPFEEAKLYGHNAVHALVGYRLRRRGARTMAEATADPELMQFAREAFLEESGAALCRKYGGVDPLFTTAGFQLYAEDLLLRMFNPHLRDAVERVTRDPQRKLGWNDRLVGTMRLVMSQGLTPTRFARGAREALTALDAGITNDRVAAALTTLWGREAAEDPRREEVIQWIKEVPNEN